jgi:hypothetical protein
MSTSGHRVLTTGVSLTASDPTLGVHLQALTASYERVDETTCSLRYRVEPGRLWRDGVLVRQTDTALDVLAAFELDLHRTVVAHNPIDGWLVHAAAIEIDSRVVLLVGPSGSGKSTVALALVNQGARYLGDDCALVTREGKVYGMSRPIGFDQGEPLGELASGFRQMTYPVRVVAGTVTHPVLLHPPVERLASQPVRLGTVVRLRYAPDEPPIVRRLSVGKALCALWPSTLGGGDPALQSAESLLREHPAYEVATESVSAACEALFEVHCS